MIAETVSIGVLSLPGAVSTIGMAPYVQQACVGLVFRWGIFQTDTYGI